MPLADISISKENDDCITLLKESGLFDDDKTAARFAASYALKNLDLSEYSPLDQYKGNFTNNKWHTHDFDGDSFFRTLISIYYEETEDLDHALRAVISIGLDAIYNVVKSNKNWSLLDLL